MNADSTVPSPDAPVPDPVPLPVEAVLDLHTFRPQDVASIVEEHLAACRACGLLEVRVVHGRGIGQLRRTVHTVLARLPWVESFALAGEHYGGAGATFVRLRPTEGQ